MTYHLKANDLKFFPNKDLGNTWQPLEAEQIITGQVCCFVADRHDPWDMFVIIDALPEYDSDGNEVQFSSVTNKIRVIYPRIRMIDGQVRLGQDRLLDNKQYKVSHKATCRLRNIEQGCCFYCTCNAEQEMRDEYALSFKPQLNNEGDYVIKTLDLKEVWTRLVCIECILDHPTNILLDKYTQRPYANCDAHERARGLEQHINYYDSPLTAQ